MAYVEQRFRQLSDFPKYGNNVFLNERITRTGAEQCFCSDTENLEEAYEIQVPPNEVINVEVCEKRQKLLGFSFRFLFYQANSATIIAISYLFRTLYGFVVPYVGYISRSDELRLATRLVLYVLMYNYLFNYQITPFYRYHYDAQK